MDLNQVDSQVWSYRRTLEDGFYLYASNCGWRMYYGQNEEDKEEICFVSPENNKTRYTDDPVGIELAEKVIMAAVPGTAIVAEQLNKLLKKLDDLGVEIVVDKSRFEGSSCLGLFSKGKIYLYYSPKEGPDFLWHEVVHFVQYVRGFCYNFLEIHWDTSPYLPKGLEQCIKENYPEESWEIEMEAYAVMYSDELKQKTLDLLDEIGVS